MRDDPSRQAAAVVSHCNAQALKHSLPRNTTWSSSRLCSFIVPQICWVSGARLAATDLAISPRGKKTNEDECTLLPSWFIQLPTKAIFKAPLRPWWGWATQCGVLTLDEMCNFYPCGPTGCVLAAGWGVGAHSGSSHILTRCLSPRLEPNAMRFLLSFPDNRCAGTKMISPAGCWFAATFSSGFLRSWPPTQPSFWTQYYAHSRDFLDYF